MDLVAVGVVDELDVAEQHEVGVLVLDELLVEGEWELALGVDGEDAAEVGIPVEVF